MDWKEKIQNNINEGEFSSQKDWGNFSTKYRRFRMVKRIKQFSAVATTIVIVGLIGYYIVQQPIQDKNITNVKNKTEKPVIVKNLASENQNIKTEAPKQTIKNFNFQNEDTEKEQSNNQEVIDSNKKNNANKIVTIVDENNDSDIVKTNISDKRQKLIFTDFTADKLQGCGTLTVQFMPKEISDSVIYLWEFGDGVFSNEKTPTHFYKSAGVFTVSLTTKYFYSDKLNQKNKKDLIVVKKMPKADFSYRCFSDKKVQLNNLSTNYEQCQWFLDGFAVSNDYSPQFLVEEGSHEISLSVNNQECKDSVSETITIVPEIKIYLPTAFTPNNDEQNDEFKPVFSNLPNSYKILIFDRLGKIVFSSNVVNRGWNGKINGQEPKEGIYMWKIVYQQKNNKPVEKSGQVKLIK